MRVFGFFFFGTNVFLVFVSIQKGKDHIYCILIS